MNNIVFKQKYDESIIFLDIKSEFVITKNIENNSYHITCSTGVFVVLLVCDDDGPNSQKTGWPTYA